MSLFLNNKFYQNKSLYIYLQTLFGISKYRSILLCASLGIDKNIKVKEINSSVLDKIEKLLVLKHQFQINMELKKSYIDNIKKKKEINSYQGIRHTYHLPVNGQRTHTNAKTQK